MICPDCHIEVRNTDYFCFNCGENLKKKPPSTSTLSQIVLYAKSLLLPPFGILWAIPYIKESDKKSKVIGVVAIALTLFVFILTLIWTSNLINSVNEEIGNQLNQTSFY